MRFVRPIVQTVDRLPKRVRDLQRLNTVAQVLVRHGFGILVTELPIPGFDRPSLTKLASDALETTPKRTVAAMRELGPTFVKLGQVLSTRSDLLPEEYCEAFAALQDDAGAMPIDVVERALDRELGEGWRARVASFDDAPLATASIAQVHAAELITGEEVVFKVQRPGLEAIIRSDLAILSVLAHQAVIEFPELESADLEGMLREFERSIVSELDFRQEAKNQARLAACFEGDGRVRIPALHPDLSTGKVLCMERLRGTKITEAHAQGFDMTAISERALTVVYDMLFVHGFFHADAHPGNVLVLDDGVIGLLDFGMVGRLTPQMRNDVISIIFALQRGDFRSIARLYYDIAIKTRRVDYRAIERDTVEVMEAHWSGNSIRDMQLGPYVVDLARKAARHGARMPPDYTMFFKALVTVEGLAKAVAPDVDPIAAAAPYVERMIRERLDLSKIQGEAFYQVLTISSLLRRLPNALSQLLDDVEGQRLRFEIKRVSDPESERRADLRNYRMVAAILGVGAALSGTLALMAEPAWVFGLPVVTVVFYLVAAVAGFSASGRGG